MPQKLSRLAHEAEGSAGGAIAGAAAGAMAGPPGVAAGAVAGALAGAAAAAAMDKDSIARAAEERRLDDEIGVTSGELGARNLEHPPAVAGAYSSASSGAAATSSAKTPAEGPMPPGDA